MKPFNLIDSLVNLIPQQPIRYVVYSLLPVVIFYLSRLVEGE
jgi:hypothetical protein